MSYKQNTKRRDKKPRERTTSTSNNGPVKSPRVTGVGGSAAAAGILNSGWVPRITSSVPSHIPFLVSNHLLPSRIAQRSSAGEERRVKIIILEKRALFDRGGCCSYIISCLNCLRHELLADFLSRVYVVVDSYSSRYEKNTRASENVEQFSNNWVVLDFPNEN